MNRIVLDQIIGDSQGCKSVAELGCMFGENLLALEHIPKRVGVEIFAPYLEDFADDKGVVVAADAVRWISKQATRSFDLVLMLDFIEHLSRIRALQTIKHAQRVGRRVIVFTPKGYMPQTPRQSAEALSRGQRLTGQLVNPWQRHVSEWHEHDLRAQGFKLVSLPLERRVLYGRWDAPQEDK